MLLKRYGKRSALVNTFLAWRRDLFFQFDQSEFHIFAALPNFSPLHFRCLTRDLRQAQQALKGRSSMISGVFRKTHRGCQHTDSPCHHSINCLIFN